MSTLISFYVDFDLNRSIVLTGGVLYDDFGRLDDVAAYLLEGTEHTPEYVAENGFKINRDDAETIFPHVRDHGYRD